MDVRRQFNINQTESGSSTVAQNAEGAAAGAPTSNQNNMMNTSDDANLDINNEIVQAEAARIPVENHQNVMENRNDVFTEEQALLIAFLRRRHNDMAPQILAGNRDINNNNI